MKKLYRSALVAFALMAPFLSGRASASVYNLSSSAGTVTVTASGADLNFDVLLSGSNNFLDSVATGLDAFVFNADKTTTITNIGLQPLPNGSSSSAADLTLPQTEGAFGIFTNGLTFHLGSKSENELTFTATGLALSDLVGNSSGFLFAADVGNSDGRPGLVGVAAVPETSTWAMMFLGFACVGFIAYRGRSRPALRFA